MSPLRITENLIKAEKMGTLHHAYLFSGPEGPAKIKCALDFLVEIGSGGGLFGQELDKEKSLLRIKNGNHPDLIRIQPNGSSIGVDEVRILSKALSYSPLEARKRIVLIESAALLNSQAANALLKILEEPPSHTMFFLLCRDPGDLLATILSRCQEIRFPPPSEEELITLLRLEFAEINEGDLKLAISLCSGSFERAKSFLALEDLRAVWLESCDRLFEYWEACPKIPSSIVQWADSIGEQEKVELVVSIWEILLRDLALAVSSKGICESTFPEFHEKIIGFARKIEITADKVAEKKSAINRFRVYRHLNGNLKLDFVSLICDLNFSVGKKRLATVN